MSDQGSGYENSMDDASEALTDAREEIDDARDTATGAIDDALSPIAEVANDATAVPMAAVNTAGAVVQSAVGGVADILSAFDRFDGLTTSSFIFAIDGVPIGAFQSVSGMQVQIEQYEIPVGGNNHSVVKRPGRMKWSNLVLRRGIATLDVLFNWINLVSGTKFSEEPTMMDRVATVGLASDSGKNMYNAQTGTLILTNRFGIPMRSWWIREALPVRWKGPDFNAAAVSSGETVPMEELEIAHEGLDKIEPI